MTERIAYEFDPFEIAGVNKSEIPRSVQNEILDDVADYVLESVLSKVGDAESPVSGRGSFKGLSKSYKQKKEEISSNPIANLELFGDMLDSLKVIKNGSSMLSLQITDTSQLGKADGHNNFSGQSNLPERRFIPKEDDGETFKRDIINGIRSIIKERID